MNTETIKWSVSEKDEKEFFESKFIVKKEFTQLPPDGPYFTMLTLKFSRRFYPYENVVIKFGSQAIYLK